MDAAWGEVDSERPPGRPSAWRRTVKPSWVGVVELKRPEQDL